MPTYTEHYQLHQWEPQDPFLRTDFNEDLKKIDLAITGLQTDFDEDLRKIDQAIAERGDCTIVTGSYVGTGLAAVDHPNTLTFQGTPKFVAIMSQSVQMILVHGVSYAYAYRPEDTYKNQIIWTDTGVSWHVSNTFQTPEEQMDEEGTTYFYVVLL